MSADDLLTSTWAAKLPIPLFLKVMGQTTIEYKKFGTQIDFVPIVLGNGNIRLEVRPRVSEPDDSRGVNLGNFVVPAFTVREVDTAVELKAGQTLALAGLVQTRVEAQERGLPFVSDLPFIGAAFRSVSEEVNEVELLILGDARVCRWHGASRSTPMWTWHGIRFADQ